ncbi:MAG: branched-chain amino acid ABC transporter permease [Candidatus Hecatellales archaeon]|nr:MAG: branched-chain amino acid ABC transporter permease [Candidatus Hecatellales archaeon]
MVPLGAEFASRFLFVLVNGFVWALIVALVALGLSFIFGLMDIVNIAHGDLYMLGAVLTWYGLAATGNFWLGVILATAVVGVLGIGLERGALRPVEGMPAYTVVVTIGISYILQQVVLAVFGGSPQKMSDPFPMVIEFLGVRYPGYRILVAGVSGIALLALWFLLFKTSVGLWIRATMQDREMANAMGISVNNIYAMTFALGAALAALGGALASPIVQVFYLMGYDLLVLVFIIVIVGGLGSLKGTMVAALIICPLESVMTLFVTPTEARVISFLVMAAVLLVRPQGLFKAWR